MHARGQPRSPVPPATRRPGFALRSGERQLLEGVAVGRHETGLHADGVSDFGDVEIAVRIDREAVWCTEAAWSARIRSADPRDYRPIRIEDAHAARQIALDLPVPERALTGAPSQLRDVHQAT